MRDGRRGAAVSRAQIESGGGFRPGVSEDRACEGSRRACEAQQAAEAAIFHISCMMGTGRKAGDTVSGREALALTK